MTDDDNFYENCRGGRRRAEESPRALDRQRAVGAGARSYSYVKIRPRGPARVPTLLFMAVSRTTTLLKFCFGPSQMSTAPHGRKP